METMTNQINSDIVAFILHHNQSSDCAYVGGDTKNVNADIAEMDTYTIFASPNLQSYDSLCLVDTYTIGSKRVNEIWGPFGNQKAALLTEVIQPNNRYEMLIKSSEPFIPTITEKYGFSLVETYNQLEFNNRNRQQHETDNTNVNKVKEILFERDSAAIAECAAIHQTCFPDSSSFSDIVSNLTANTKLLVFQSDQVVLGYFLFELREQSGWLSLEYLAVDPDQQRQGVATALFEYVINHFDFSLISLMQPISHQAAFKFYQSVGFTLTEQYSHLRLDN